MAHSISRYRATTTGLDGFEILAVFGFVVSKQEYVLKSLWLFNDREFVNIELVVFGA